MIGKDSEYSIPIADGKTLYFQEDSPYQGSHL